MYWTDERKLAHRARTGCLCPVWEWSGIIHINTGGAYKACPVHKLIAAFFTGQARYS